MKSWLLLLAAIACTLLMSTSFVDAALRPNLCNNLACDANNTCGSGYCCNGLCVTPPATRADTDGCTSANRCDGTCQVGGCQTPCLAAHTSNEDGCACISNDGCKSGLCYQGYCVEKTKLEPNKPCYINEQCLSNICSMTTYTCQMVAAAADGAACNVYTPCGANSYCKAYPAARRHLLSTPSPRFASTSSALDYETIVSQAAIHGEDYIDEMLAHAGLAQGPSSARGVSARADLKAGVCTPKQEPGSVCSYSNGGTIVIVLELRWGCLPVLPTVDYNPCAGGICEYGVYANGTNYHCAAKAPVDGVCAVDADCQTGLRCNGATGKCIIKCGVAANGVCSGDYQCTSGYACQVANLYNTTGSTGTCVTGDAYQAALENTRGTQANGAPCKQNSQCAGIAYCCPFNGTCVGADNAVCGGSLPLNYFGGNCGNGDCQCNSATHEYACMTPPNPLPCGPTAAGNLILAGVKFQSDSASPPIQGRLSLHQPGPNAYQGLSTEYKDAIVAYYCCAACMSAGAARKQANDGWQLDCNAKTVGFMPTCGGVVTATITCANSNVGVGPGLTSTYTGNPATGAGTSGLTSSTTDSGNATTTSAAAASVMRGALASWSAVAAAVAALVFITVI